MVRLLILALILLVAGCNSQNAQKDVDINTSGIFTPVSLSHSGKEVGLTLDLGEYLIGTGAKIYKFTVRNNSLFPLTELGMTLENNEAFGFTFEKNEEAKAKFPGKSGTCGSILNPGESCIISLQFETSITKVYEQPVSFTYLNYVEAAKRDFNLILLAGNPASLIFEGEETNFFYGEKVGLAEIPIIEREIDQEYVKDLKVINAGDLAARNLSDSTITLTQSCNSPISGDCPAGQNTAYRITHDCPSVLKHNESCNIKLYFRPKNQAAIPSYKHIRYDGILKLNYFSSSYGTEGMLNGYVTTNSVNIEAIFETSIESQIFENKIVVGNRDVRLFRINNRGFRSGYLRKLVTKDLFGLHVASCVADSGGSQWMVCYDETLTTELTLAQFPFKIKDKDDCFASPLDTGKIIPVDQGCAFEFYFQPSNSYMTARTFDYELFAEYDSLWKGNTTITENQLHTYKAESLAAALLIPVSMSYNSSAISVETDDHKIVTYDAGRMGLQSPSYFRRKPLLVTFKNIGGVAATSIVGKDGRNNTIPQKEINPAGVELGTYNPKYYTSSLINTTNCDTILPNNTCTMQFSFAPITMYDWNLNAENMFDVINTAVPLESYKQFIMNYQNGSKYTDGNFTTTVIDSGADAAEARLQVDMVEKGQLDEYVTQAFGMGQQTPLTSYRREIKFTNIGTKDIPYLHYRGDVDLNSLTWGIKIIPTDPAKLTPPSVVDCKGIIDFNYLNTDTLVEINARSANWDPLKVNSECILTLEFNTPARALTGSDVQAGISNGKEPGRNKYVAYNNSSYAWEFQGTTFLDVTFQFDAYDGDLTDPTATGPYASQFGKHQPGKPLPTLSAYRQPGKLSLYSPRPLASAILYRPGWNRPQINNELGVMIAAASTVPDFWWFSDYNEAAAGFMGYDADFHKAILSKNFVPAGLATLPDVNDYEYVLYLGSVPAGTTLNGKVIIANSGSTMIEFFESTLNTILRPNPLATSQNFSSDLTTTLYPKNMMFTIVNNGSVSNGFTASIAFSGTDTGVYASELVLKYKDGVFDNPGPYLLPIPMPDPRVLREVQKKVLVIAEVINAPSLSMDVQDYDVTTDDLTPAVESLGAINPVTMGYFENGSSLINFTSIKIPSPKRKDSFIKKRFIFSNPSTTQTIEDVKLFFRTNASSATKDGLSSGTSYYVCYSGSQTNASLAAVNSSGVDQPMCTGTCGQGPFNIAPGGSCYIEVRFQPVATTGTKSVTLTALHKLGTDRYVHRNLDLTFQPQDPAMVTIANRSTQIIRTSVGNFTSFNLDFGTVIQTENPQKFTYNGAINGGWNRQLAFNNPTTTKASFLKTYQLYYKQFIDPSITDDLLRQKEPTYPDDYTLSVGTNDYALIWQQNYPSTTSPRIQIWANRACLVGDGSGVWFTRGFTGASCMMVPILFADINYINRFISVSSTADMDVNHVRLQYYSANRGSTSAVTFHFSGNLMPNTTASGNPSGINFYQEVTATSTSNGQVTFKWNEMTPTTPGLGPIVGYRIYYSTSLSPVNTVFPAPATTYVDTPVNGTGIYQLTHSNLGMNRYMYYRIFPIRQNAAYTHSPNPFGLPSGKYLSNPAVPALTVVVPNNNFFYQHIGKYLIERGVYDENILTHAAAKSRCSTRIRHSIIDGSTIRQISFSMINIPVWNVIKSRPTESTYNLEDYPTWLDNSSLNIHTTLLPNPEYNSSNELAYLEASKIFYIKKSGCGTNCSGNTAVGSAFGQPGYTSYIEPAVPFGGARCFVQLP